MSYRRKRSSAMSRPDHPNPLLLPASPTEATYSNPGVDKVIHSARLISGQAYQRPVREENVNELIAKWNELLQIGRAHV